MSVKLHFFIEENALPTYVFCSLQTFSDGKWHTVQWAMSKNYAVLIIDNEKAETNRILDFSTGPYYMIGGGIYGQTGFIGCMRHITIDGNYKLPGDWKNEEVSSKDDLGLESCMVMDRCTPNPCEHGGVCKQNSEDFYCECENTG